MFAGDGVQWELNDTKEVITCEPVFVEHFQRQMMVRRFYAKNEFLLPLWIKCLQKSTEQINTLLISLSVKLTLFFVFVYTESITVSSLLRTRSIFTYGSLAPKMSFFARL